MEIIRDELPPDTGLMLSYRPLQGYVLIANSNLPETKVRRLAAIALEEYLRLGYWVKKGSFRITVNLKTELPHPELVNPYRRSRREWKENEIGIDYNILG